MEATDSSIWENCTTVISSVHLLHDWVLFVLFFVLQELCLHTKLLASPNTSISDFLSKAPEAPPFLVLRNAIALLKVGSDKFGKFVKAI